MNKRKHNVFCSSGLSLRMTDAENDTFEKEKEALYLKYYRMERAECGIWAGNQNKYVTSPDQLNDWDGDYMEKLHAKCP